MRFLFFIIGAIVGLLVVRGFMLNVVEVVAWKLFWKDIFNMKINILGVKDLIQSTTFIKSCAGFFIGGIAGRVVSGLVK